MHVSIPAILACLATGALSWQQEVHNQIGFMADAMVSDRVREMARSILEPKYEGSLGLAGGWADTVRKTTHPYSYGWHFISARDNPPNDCNLFYHRDCQAGGCVVQQIGNQTEILESCLETLKDQGKDFKLNVTCSEALKWVVHFTGDVAQPLHTSERSYGGNTVKVVFNGTNTNLHQAWDQVMLYALGPLPNGASGTKLDPYFADLVARIFYDTYHTPVSTWMLCDADARRGTYCAEQWAKDSNGIVCDYAYGVLNATNDLLTGPDRYAEGALPIINQQIAKAAFRLSLWLQTLVDRVLYDDEGGSEKMLRSSGLAVQGGRGGAVNWDL